MARCIECQAGYCWFCEMTDLHTVEGCPCGTADEPTGRVAGGQVKENSAVTDITSTGRKRAAELYPIVPGMECQWAGLKKAGGGRAPIIGCLGNRVTARHHGPDKNTLHNEAGNVHLICVHCHNRWHTANDAYYAGERPEGDMVDSPWTPVGEYNPHDPTTKATPEEIVNNEIYWSTKKLRTVDLD